LIERRGSCSVRSGREDRDMLLRKFGTLGLLAVVAALMIEA
jgi:hypothetical protein